MLEIAQLSTWLQYPGPEEGKAGDPVHSLCHLCLESWRTVVCCVNGYAHIAQLFSAGTFT